MKRTQWPLLVGMVAVALTLRPAIASVAPVLETILTDLAISNSIASLLTTIPILCMGVFALVLLSITDWLGRFQSILWSVVLIGVMTAARVGGRNVSLLFGSTILVSVGIGVTQAVLPALVTKHFPERGSFATGLYTASMTVGAILATLLTAPLSGLSSWPLALAFWSLPAIIAVPIWLFASRASEPVGENEFPAAGRDGGLGLPWRQHSAWVLVAIFSGATANFFSVLTWLPPRYVALGWSPSEAGFLITVCLVVQTISNLTISAIGDRWTDKRPLFVVMICSFVTGASGVALLPFGAPLLWTVLLGIGSGGIFTLSMTLPITHAQSPAETDRLTSMMLGVGYIVGALGPIIGGVLRDVTGSDTVVFSALVVYGLSLLGPVFLLGNK